MNWLRQICTSRNGLKTALNRKLEMLLKAEREESNLDELIDTKVQ